MADLPYKLSDAPPAVQPPLEKWSHEAVMKWFNSLPENDKKKFGAFFNDPECFPLVAEGKARMGKEDFIAILGRILGASLYEELQPLKAKAASGPLPAQPSAASGPTTVQPSGHTLNVVPAAAPTDAPGTPLQKGFSRMSIADQPGPSPLSKSGSGSKPLRTNSVPKQWTAVVKEYTLKEKA